MAALLSPYVVDTTLLQDNQPPGSITPADIRTMNDSLAGLVPSTQSGTTYTPALTDAGTVIEFTSSSAITVTIPTNATVNFPTGTVLAFCQIGTGQITIAAAGGVTIITPSSSTTRAQNSTISIRQRATTNTWILAGDLT